MLETIKQHYIAEKTILGLAVTTLVVLLFDYDINFPHNENYALFTACSKFYSKGISWEDFKLLISPCFENFSPRARFYSFLTWALNLKGREAVFQFIPFHPSFAPSWIISLILCPIFLYKLMKAKTNDKALSLNCTSAFLLSIGFLSNHLMLFWPAKPVGVAMFVISLYFPALIATKVHHQEVVRGKYFLAWGGTLLLSLYWDELFYSYFLIVFLIFPELYLQRSIRKYFIGTLSITLGLLFFSIFFLFPWLYRVIHNFDYNIFKYALKTNSGIKNVSFHSIWFDLKSLIVTHFDFVSPQKIYYWKDDQPYFAIIVLFFFVFTIAAYFKSNKRKKILLTHLSFFAIVVFTNFVMSRRDGQLFYGGAYWGSFASIWLIVSTYLTLHYTTFSYKRAFSIMLTIVLLFAGYKNSVAALIGHQGTIFVSHPYNSVATSTDVKSLSLAENYLIWKNREQVDRVQEELKKLPPHSAWLYFESYLQANDGDTDFNRYKLFP